MSIIKKTKEAKRETRRAYQEAKKEARRAYEGKMIETHTAEHNAMNEMLDILRTADHPMTAAQIEAACTSGISKHEIAGNLFAMRAHHSRYENDWTLGGKIPVVSVPKQNSEGKGERIVTKGGGNRRATIVEVDENGHIIPNSKQVATIYESNRYGIKKTE